VVEQVTPIGATVSLPSTRGQIPALTAGQVVDARVLAIMNNGTVRLAIAGVTVEAATTTPLTPGSTVRLLAQEQGGALKLSVVDQTQVSAPPTPTGEAARPPAAEGAAVPLARALAGLVARQSSLAPLFADLEHLLGSGPAGAARTAALPAEVVAAAAKVLDFRLPAGEAGNPARILASFLTSGVFHDAAAQRQPPGQGLAGQLAPAQAVAGQVTAGQVAAQTSLQRLGQAVGQMLGGQMLGGQAGGQVTGTAGDPAARQMPTQAAASGSPGSSGLALRSLLAMVTMAAPAAGSATPSSPSPVLLPLPDLKSALIELRSALVGALGTDAVRLGAIVAPNDAARPPRRGAPPRAQPAVAPLLGAEASPREVLRTLLSETDGALARLSLTQLASSDADRPVGIGPADKGAAPVWTFEVPLAADGRTSIAQIEIRREESRAAAAGETAPGWSVKFSIDVEPAGPVHAVLTLRGADLSVTLWAERPATAAQLQAEGGGFAALLADQDLTLERLFVRGGRPDAPPEPVRHLVNRVT
jgi:hypothetical protein